MYKLYWDSGTAAMAAHAALEEIATPFELIRVDLDKAEQRSDWYLKINPLGRVPALAHNVQVITEAAAILMYIADRHPSARLAPAIDARIADHICNGWLSSPTRPRRPCCTGSIRTSTAARQPRSM